MYCAEAKSDVMCSASSRAKRTSLAKQTSRPKGISRSAQAEHIVPKTKALLTKCFCFWRRHPDLNRGIEVLQTFALPLGHVALFSVGFIPRLYYHIPFSEILLLKESGRDSLAPILLERITGLEPATFALARRRSTK